MTRRKKKLVRKFVKKTFGNKFNFWDILIIAALVVYPIILIKTRGLAAFFEDISAEIFYGLITVAVVRYFLKKSKK